MIINFKTSSKVNPQIYKIIAAILRNGPKGIILSFLKINKARAIGNAMKVAKNILHTDIGYPITKPTKNINLISPPPSDSCLKIRSPSFFISSIVINAPTPDKTHNEVLYSPISNISTIIMAVMAKINTSSKIIIYSMSLMMIVIRLETNIKAVINFSSKPKT